MRTNIRGWLIGLGVAGIVQACGTGTDFAAVVLSPVGIAPSRPAVADFTGDGIPDVVVARGAAPFGIDVMIGKGDGTLAAGAASPLAQAAACTSAAAGDFNKDGKQDFAVGVGSGKISVYLGDGKGAFTITPSSPMTFASSAVNIGRLLVADLNNDTKLDVVGVVPTGAQIAVVLGDGTGGFGTAATYSTGASTTPTDLALLQASGDTFLDVAVSSSSTTTVPLFINKGDGTFNAAVDQALGTNTYGIASGDSNKDLKDDVVVNDGVQTYTLMKGAKNSTLTKQTGIANDNNPTTARAQGLLDLDHDGNLDAFMIDSQATGAVHASKGDGTGLFGTALGYSLGGSTPISLDFADFNQDGAPDVLSVLSPASPTAGQLAVIINSHATAIALAADPASPSTLGTSVKFTATLSQVFGSVPSGNVVFKDGASTLATVALVGGIANYTTSALTQGAHSITVSYAGDTACFPRDSAAIAYNVRGDSKTTLTSSANPSVNGQQVVLTATVAPVAPATGVPAGTVTFTDGAVTVGTGTLDGAGVATFTTSSLTLATHAMTASYAGNSAFAPSVSASLSQAVNKADSAIALISSSNPSIKGESVTFTATASVKAPGAGTLNGSIKFFDGATQIGTSAIAPATGVATLAVSNLTVATHSITASYDGTSILNGTVSNAVSQSVTLGAATVAVTSSKNPSVLGDSVTFTAKLTTSSGATPTGQVQFLDGTTLLTTSNLSGGQAGYQTSTLTGGTHAITAKYLGDSNNGSATGALSQVVSRLTSTATLAASQESANEGDTIDLTVMVAPAAASGSVTFKDGDVTIGTGTLAAGSAKLTTPPLSAGAHSFVAVYDGDTTYDTATSAIVTVTAAAATSEPDAGPGPVTTGGKDSGPGTGTETGTDTGDTGSGDDGGGCSSSRTPIVPGGMAAAAFATFALALVRRRAKK